MVKLNSRLINDVKGREIRKDTYHIKRITKELYVNFYIVTILKKKLAICGKSFIFSPSFRIT